MTTSRNARPSQGRGNENFGLLANGSSGEWDVAIDEATSGVERWYAQIEGPTVYFYFEIPSLDIVGELLRFLERGLVAAKRSLNGSDERNGSLMIGKVKKTPITLFKDDEYLDRFFLVVGPTDSPMVRFVLAGKDAAEITEALRQVEEDLEEEG
ncbi:MAG TPA: hypothetical protein VN688_05985 [Gemmataceae bacterium]|nr:hypothetical protein [Gemmataceae bacterium]